LSQWKKKRYPIVIESAIFIIKEKRKKTTYTLIFNSVGRFEVLIHWKSCVKPDNVKGNDNNMLLFNVMQISDSFVHKAYVLFC